LQIQGVIDVINHKGLWGGGGNFREFCGKAKGTLIEGGGVCDNYESKGRLSEMVLTF